MASELAGRLHSIFLLLLMQNQAREQLSAATSELDVLRLTLEEVRARNDKLERSHSHLKKQKTQLLADLQVRRSVSLLHWQRATLLCLCCCFVQACLHATVAGGRAAGH